MGRALPVRLPDLERPAQPPPRRPGRRPDPGTALDVGSGEGADAIWLAKAGWRVTALDISPVALERAADHAAEAGPEVAGRITWRHADVAAADTRTWAASTW